MIQKIKSNYLSLSKPVKASIWFTVCYVIQRGIQFLCMPLFTRIMSQSEYGHYSVFFSWFNILAIFSSLEICKGTFNRAMIRYLDDRDGYTASVQGLTLATSSAFCLMLIIFKRYVSLITGFSNTLIYLMCINLIAYPSLQYWLQIQRFAYEYRRMIIVTIINSVVSTMIGIVLALFSNHPSEALIFSIVIVNVIVSVVIGKSIYKKNKTFYHSEYWIWSLTMSLPLVPHYLSEVLLGHSDRIMINVMCGSAQAGIYNIVYQISMVMTILRIGINGAFVPWMYNELHNGNNRKIKELTSLLTYFTAGLIAVFIIIGPELLKLAAPESYYEAVIDIPAIMVACFFTYVYVLFVSVELYYEKKLFVALASIVTAIINIFLNYMFIPILGYLVAGYTTMISFMGLALAHYFFYRIALKDKCVKERLFDVKAIIISTALLITLGISCIILYKLFWIRLTLILTLSYVCYKKRMTIANVVREVKK